MKENHPRGREDADAVLREAQEIDLTDRCDWMTPVTSPLHDFVAKAEGYRVCRLCGKAIRMG